MNRGTLTRKTGILELLLLNNFDTTLTFNNGDHFDAKPDIINDRLRETRYMKHNFYAREFAYCLQRTYTITSYSRNIAVYAISVFIISIL